MARLSNVGSDTLLRKLVGKQHVTCRLVTGQETAAGWIVGFDPTAIFFTATDRPEDTVAYMRPAVVQITRPGGLMMPNSDPAPEGFTGFAQYIEFLRRSVGVVQCRPLVGDGGAQPMVGLIDHLDGGVLWLRDLNQDIREPIERWVLLSGLVSIGRSGL